MSTLTCIPASPGIWNKIRRFGLQCVSQGMVEIPGSSQLHLYLEDKESWYHRLYAVHNNEVVFFTVSEEFDGYVGVFSIRRSTTYNMLSGACNFSHSVRPDLRCQGFGKCQIYLGMQMMAMLGESYMLIGVSRDNMASISCITGVGGQFLYETSGRLVYKIPMWC